MFIKFFMFLLMFLVLISDEFTTAKYTKGSSETYLKPCSEDYECIDFRFICDEKRRICDCTRFYNWNSVAQECHLNVTELKDWLQLKNYDPEDNFGRNSNYKFYVQAAAGFMAIISLCFISVVICSIAFCVCKRGDEERKHILKSEVLVEAPSTSTG